MSGTECVKVAIRIRPMSKSELARGCQSVVEQTEPDSPQILVCGGRTPSDVFTYSYVFSPGTSQSDLYAASVAPMLERLFAGFNATILAYGQTSSGKTFTMGTDFTGELSENMGVIPRAIRDIFRTIQENSAMVDASIICSFIEVYQDNVYDLLAEKNGTNRKPVEIREAVNGDIVLQGLTEVPATTDQDAFDCLARGAASRVVRATAMNNVSSRSHAIFTLTVQQRSMDKPPVVTRSKFHLVDLAGSERSKKTAATDERFREGVEINKCLLVLGNVITALATTSGVRHVPYRSSKLTRLLQDSLGGNSCTLMIACVSPADYNLSETHSTLRYAYRVCQIKNKPIVNRDPQQARIRELEAIIQDMRLEILSLKVRCDGAGADSIADTSGKLRHTPLPLARCLTEPEIYSPAHAHGDSVAAQQKQQETVRSLQAQLQSLLHEREKDEVRAMTAEKLHEDIGRVLAASETDGGSEGQLRQIADLLAAYNEEAYALGVGGDGARPVIMDGTMNADEYERKHTQQQMLLHQQLSQLKRELALKEQLHRQCTDNSAFVNTLSTERERSLTEKLRESENQIRGLEEQLAELNAVLENTKASEKRSKLAEERRRKVQQLEAELAELRQASKRQAKLLKVTEKDAQRLAGLSAEIQQMKATRVKLLKTLRTESESFRQWRQEREKEISQLKAKDRKRQYELQKLESTYTMQRTIMQRKMQETILVNKRLKETLERRERRKAGNAPAAGSALRGADAKRWLKHELELLLDTVDASVTLKVLQAQRVEQTEKLAQLRSQLRATLTAEDGESVAERRAKLEEEHAQCQTDLDYRNAQIANLQQKIHQMETDSQVVVLGEALAKLPEAREAFQRLLEQLVQTQTRLIETHYRLLELQARNECQELELAQARAQCDQIEQTHKEQVVQLEKTFEDKLALLLTQRSGQPTEQDGPVHEEAIRRIEQLREELEQQQADYAALQRAYEAATTLPARPRKVPRRLIEDSSSLYDEDDMDYEEEGDNQQNEMHELLELERDPDFRGTPLSKRKKSVSVLSSTLQSNHSGTMNTSTIACSCSGSCGTKRCGCKKHGSFCGTSCKCPPGCVNHPLAIVGETTEPAGTEPADTESEDQQKQAKQDSKENTFVIPAAPAPRVKDERDELDILEYVAKYRKRKPLLDI
uniref:Kinesin motor domain-containing protein n=1 Tax=Anopheles farauti TaxID=69004 RepID=A0A182QKX4_9DIPT